jgi:hypothetical protein
MNEQTHIKDREFLERLEAHFEDAFSDEKELDRLLINQGYDPQNDTEESLRLVKRLLLERKIVRARAKRKEVDQLIQRRIGKYSKVASDKLWSLLENAFLGSRDKPAIQVSFRHLEGSDDEEVRAILEDADLLKEIETLFRDDNDPNYHATH